MVTYTHINILRTQGRFDKGENKMKRKMLVVFLMSLVLALSLAIFVNAEETVIPEWTETQTITGIAPKDGFDTTSRVMLKNSDGSYVVYPAYYILKCTDTTFSKKDSGDEFDYSAIKNAIGVEYTNGSVVRLEIPVGFTTVQDRVFRKDKGFTSLLTLKVPEGVTTMGEYNFYESECIQEIDLPNSLTEIVKNFAPKVASLKRVSVGSGTKIVGYAFQDCTGLEQVTLAEGITTIEERAFLRCASLDGVVLPNSLTSLGTSAFYGCSSLTEIVIPENVVLGDGVFKACTALAKVVVKCDKIPGGTFSGDSSLGIFVVTKNISSMGTDAFGSVKSPFLTIYEGDDPEKLGTLYNYSRFTKADFVSYEQYLEDVKNGVVYTKDTIVYGANYCVELNGGVHQMTDEPTCTQGVKCSKCGLEGASALGHNKGELEKIVYVTFDVAGDKLFDCTRCEESVVEQGGASPIFTAKGYSTNPDKNAINGGYSVNLKALELYEEINGQIEYGIVIANAKAFGGKTLFDANNEVNSSKALRVEIEGDYANFDCSIMFGANAGADLTLIICAYVIDANGVHTVQHATGTEIENEYISGGSYKGVTLAMVIANLPSGVRNDEE